MIDKLPVLHSNILKILSDTAFKSVFKSSYIEKTEILGLQIIHKFLDEMVPAVLKIDGSPNNYEKKMINVISQSYVENYMRETECIDDEKEKNYYRIKLVTDFICGMTDSYAYELYKELFVS